MTNDDQYHLNRFIKAQETVYNSVVCELKYGQKRSHWIWFIFPQIDGLGHSETARYYAIKSIQEAQDYLHHPVLGARLQECTQAVLNIEGQTLAYIFGYPDDRKFKSSMTLFAYVSSPGSVFEQALEQYCHGEQDSKTLELISSRNQPSSP